jgi:cyclase
MCRSWKIAVALSFWILSTLSAVCLAQQAQPLAVQKIKGNAYLVKGGSGANTGFYVGDQEVLLIDAKMSADSMKQVIEEIRKVTPNPVTRLVLTHSDGDHVNGLNGLPKGLKIYGHPQTKKDLEAAAQAANMQYLADYLPTETCSPCTASRESAQTFAMGSAQVQLYFFGPAHTSGDLIVWLPAERVAFVGDLAFVGRDPLIHRQKGGNSQGLVETLKNLIALNAEAYITGHSDPLTRQDMETLQKSIADKRDKVKALIAEGKSLDDIKQSFGIKDAPAQPGRARFLSLVEVIYLELTEKK